VVELPQQNIPVTQETEITGTPLLARRIYGPGKPGSGSPPVAETIYTVPAGKRTTITMLLANNTDTSSPPVSDFINLSIGPDSDDTRFFSAQVDPGFPLAIELELTLEAGETIQALPSTVTLTLNALEATA
jgi:hypothetical protein